MLKPFQNVVGQGLELGAFLVEQHKVVHLDVFNTLSEMTHLRDFIIKKLLIGQREEKRGGIGEASQLLLELIEHFLQHILHAELSLESVENIHFILFFLREEPSVGQRTLQNYGNREPKYFRMSRYEMEE